MKITKVLLMQFFFLVIVPLLADAKLCSGSDTYNEANYTRTATVSWGVTGDSCCSPNPGPGAALVQVTSSIYVPGFGWQSDSYSYYITIDQAQYAANCPPLA
jgi:hypothetical protein